MKSVFSIQRNTLIKFSSMALVMILVILFDNSASAQTNTFPATGNVGIGTTGPLVKLGVRLDNAAVDDGIRIDQRGAGDAILRFATQNNTRFSIGVDQSEGNSLKIGAGTSVSNNTFLTMLSNGDIGIGTTTPGANLDIFNDGIARIRLRGDNGGGPEVGAFIDLNPNAQWFQVGTITDHPFRLIANNTQHAALLPNGNFGLGTLSPNSRLSVKGFGSGGTIRIMPDSTDQETAVGFLSEPDGTGNNWIVGVSSWAQTGKFVIGASIVGGTSGPKLVIDPDGSVGIGTSDPQNKLDVCGTIRANEVKVETGWCDYVFEDEYKLTSLEEVQSHINEKGYLHRTPSATEVETEGLKLAEATVQQQEKIEEIFLHLIQLNEKVKALETENQALKAQLSDK